MAALYSPLPQLQAQVVLVDSLREKILASPPDTNRLPLLKQLFIATIDHSSADSAMRIAREELLLASKSGHLYGQATAYTHLGICSIALGDTEAAMNYYLKALPLFEKSRAREGMASLYHNIGQCYADKEQWNEATTYMNKAIEIDKSNRDTANIIYMNNKLADLQQKQGHYQLAIYYYGQALQLNKQKKITAYQVSSYLGLGETKIKMKEYDSATDWIEKAMALSPQYEVDHYTRIRIANDLSEVAQARGQYSKALKLAKDALEMAKKAGYKPETSTGLWRVSEVLKSMQEYEQALDYFKAHILLKDSLTSVKVLNGIRSLTYRYELEKKEDELHLLNSSYSQAIFKRNTFIGGLLALLLFTFLIYNRKQLIHKKALALKQQQLENASQNLLDKLRLIDEIKVELTSLKPSQPVEGQEIERFHKILHSNILTEEAWQNFRAIFEEVHPLFFSTLRYRFPQLSLSELRLLSLIKLNLKLKEMTSILCITEEGVKKMRYRLKKKLELNTSLEEFVHQIK